MTGKTLVVAALLLTSLGRVAAAADPPIGVPQGHQPFNAQKVIVVLGYVGVNDHNVKDFIGEMDTHVRNGAFDLSEQRVPGGTFLLHYQFSTDSDLPTIGKRRAIELKFSPDHSPVEATVRPGCALMGIHVHF